mmetsp:Transcript_28210/g.68612  ORF Transcript_28210/g.68612 Transcript_28210/m.68612 type:complete len:267 (+) Transcript_28210:1643-2443(+)
MDHELDLALVLTSAADGVRIEDREGGATLPSIPTLSNPGSVYARPVVLRNLTTHESPPTDELDAVVGVDLAIVPQVCLEARHEFLVEPHRDCESLLECHRIENLAAPGEKHIHLEACIPRDSEHHVGDMAAEDVAAFPAALRYRIRVPQGPEYVRPTLCCAVTGEALPHQHPTARPLVCDCLDQASGVDLDLIVVVLQRNRPAITLVKIPAADAVDVAAAAKHLDSRTFTTARRVDRCGRGDGGFESRRAIGRGGGADIDTEDCGA